MNWCKHMDSTSPHQQEVLRYTLNEPFKIYEHRFQFCPICAKPRPTDELPAKKAGRKGKNNG